MKQSLLLVMLIFFTLSYGQGNPIFFIPDPSIQPVTTPCNYVFLYDKSGNQILREQRNCDPPLVWEVSKSNNELNQAIHRVSSTSSNEDFFKEVKIYPNPVKDYLTVEWSEAIGKKIYQVMVFQHSNLHWVYTSDKTALANRKFKLNMQELPYGVYVLTFILQDGKRMSANVSKLQ